MMTNSEFNDLLAQNTLLEEFVLIAERFRAARELAEEEYLEGVWVDEVERPALERRLAAQDSAIPRAAFLVGGPYRLRFFRDQKGQMNVIQEDGPEGASLLVDEKWIPLQRGKRIAIVGIKVFPRWLTLVDINGRRWKLLTP